MILTAELRYSQIKTPLFGYRSKHLPFLIKTFRGFNRTAKTEYLRWVILVL